jgi:GxxExxY protein
VAKTRRTEMMDKHIRDEETYTLIGLAMKVHGELGGGFLEAVYQEAFELELQNASVPYEREKKLEVYYCKKKLNVFYLADFICYGSIVVEMKAIRQLTCHDEAQLLNYLKATGCKKGLLFNFGCQSLEYKRMVF